MQIGQYNVTQRQLQKVAHAYLTIRLKLIKIYLRGLYGADARTAKFSINGAHQWHWMKPRWCAKLKPLCILVYHPLLCIRRILMSKQLWQYKPGTKQWHFVWVIQGETLHQMERAFVYLFRVSGLNNSCTCTQESFGSSTTSIYQIEPT